MLLQQGAHQLAATWPWLLRHAGQGLKIEVHGSPCAINGHPLDVDQSRMPGCRARRACERVQARWVRAGTAARCTGVRKGLTLGLWIGQRAARGSQVVQNGVGRVVHWSDARELQRSHQSMPTRRAREIHFSAPGCDHAQRLASLGDGRRSALIAVHRGGGRVDSVDSVSPRPLRVVACRGSRGGSWLGKAGGGKSDATWPQDDWNGPRRVLRLCQQYTTK